MSNQTVTVLKAASTTLVQSIAKLMVAGEPTCRIEEILGVVGDIKAEIKRLENPPSSPTATVNASPNNGEGAAFVDTILIKYNGLAHNRSSLSIQISLKDWNIIRSEIRRGYKIQAIKHFRSLSNWGLLESKTVIEDTQNFPYLASPLYQRIQINSTGGIYNQLYLRCDDYNRIANFVAGGSKIDAIKELRRVTGIGVTGLSLKDAKDTCLDPENFVQYVPKNVSIFVAGFGTYDMDSEEFEHISHLHVSYAVVRLQEWFKRYKGITLDYHSARMAILATGNNFNCPKN